jgi:hypothetical protein
LPRLGWYPQEVGKVLEPSYRGAVNLTNEARKAISEYGSWTYAHDTNMDPAAAWFSRSVGDSQRDAR